MKLTDREVMQAITDALAALALALGRQIDPVKMAADLRTMADNVAAGGPSTRASAGLIDELARSVESQLLSALPDKTDDPMH